MHPKSPKPTSRNRRYGRTSQSLSIVACGMGFAGVVFSGCARPTLSTQPVFAALPQEVRLKNIRPLTAGGTDTRPSWSPDGKWLAFQHENRESGCSQIFRMRSDGSDRSWVTASSLGGQGQGQAIDAYFFPDQSRILYSGTFTFSPACRNSASVPFRTQLFSSKPDGADPLPLEPGEPRAYNAEATTCHDGSVVFTSDRDDDLELYIAKLDPLGSLSAVQRITQAVGYDGAASYSNDCRQLTWSASHLTDREEIAAYQARLKIRVALPGKLEIWTADADGNHARQVTRLGATSFAPVFTPDGRRILFASNFRDPSRPGTDLYLINLNGTGLERVTYAGATETFPRFSPDGKQLAFSSGRISANAEESNIFTAEWAGAGGGGDSDSPGPAEQRGGSRRSFFQNGRKTRRARDRGTRGRHGRTELGRGFHGPTFRAGRTAPVLPDLPRCPGRRRLQTGSGSAGQAGGVGAYLGRSQYPWNLGNRLHPNETDSDQRAPGPVGVRQSPGAGRIRRSAATGRASRCQIHPGADDNASGVATLLESARFLETTASPAHSCYLFAAFTAEETGGAGAVRLIETLRSIHAQPRLILDLDAVGRMEGGLVRVTGTGSAPAGAALAAGQCAAHQLECPDAESGPGERGTPGVLQCPCTSSPLFHRPAPRPGAPDRHGRQNQRDRRGADRPAGGRPGPGGFAIGSAPSLPEVGNHGGSFTKRPEVHRRLPLGSSPTYSKFGRPRPAWSRWGFRFRECTKGVPAEKAGVQGRGCPGIHHHPRAGAEYPSSRPDFWTSSLWFSDCSCLNREVELGIPGEKAPH